MKTTHKKHFGKTCAAARAAKGSQGAKEATYTIRLTQKEWKALKAITRNGWGDGDYQGYGGENPKTQIRAMKKLDNPQPE